VGCLHKKKRNTNFENGGRGRPPFLRPSNPGQEGKGNRGEKVKLGEIGRSGSFQANKPPRDGLTGGRAMKQNKTLKTTKKKADQKKGSICLTKVRKPGKTPCWMAKGENPSPEHPKLNPLYPRRLGETVTSSLWKKTRGGKVGEKESGLTIRGVTTYFNPAKTPAANARG